MRSTPSLPSLPGSLWPGMVAPDRGLSIGQIELFDIKTECKQMTYVFRIYSYNFKPVGKEHAERKFGKNRIQDSLVTKTKIVRHQWIKVSGNWLDRIDKSRYFWLCARSEFVLRKNTNLHESHWVPHSFGLVLRKLLPIYSTLSKIISFLLSLTLISSQRATHSSRQLEFQARSRRWENPAVENMFIALSKLVYSKTVSMLNFP